MFFELHSENRIGYKKLSSADLGIGESSHQTHIGLSEHVLTFLSDRDTVSEDSIFIYEDKFEYIDAYFDRIERPDGSFRSPKIRVGDRGCISIVSTIREIVSYGKGDTEWYLIWFGLKNEKIVFFLFNSTSSDYVSIVNGGLNLDKKGAKALDNATPVVHKLFEYFEDRVNRSGLEVLKELEVASQIQEWGPNKRFKKYDVDMANRQFKEIGRKGEQLIANYLDKKVIRGQLLCYEWHNKESESGFPYDFTIQDKNSNVCYLDVKTTSYNFNQKMIFSTQEIDFISNHATNYCIYRVYKTEDEQYSLKICENCKDLSNAIWEQTTLYTAGLGKNHVELKSAKLAISPEIALLKFKPEVNIAI